MQLYSYHFINTKMLVGPDNCLNRFSVNLRPQLSFTRGT